MVKITSLNNEKVKEWVKLSKKKYRDATGLFLVESEHLVQEAIKLDIVKEIITEEEREWSGIPVYVVTKDILKKISNLECAPKMMAVVKIVNAKEIKGRVLILDHIQDPGNLGTMLRSAVAFGFNSIILSEDTVDVYNDKVIRASEGMIFKLNIVRGNIKDIIKELKKNNYTVYGTDVVNGKLVQDIAKEELLAVVIGNEGQGVDKEVKELCQENIYIPIKDNCESLNAAVAASIIMYEISR